ncbi:hypothetical protein EXIGUO9Y_190107 [Exiguobacterium oxidotolerans]|uniref:Uncharacterized protein n=1 Tax=Exiguobacterium oxidotolerans TaxID=223958 RepID=A0A653I7B6_9BACL|nr:hypothetical protein EXIGUO9Y_190107 [Exiguobacterium oxidotolerans]
MSKESYVYALRAKKEKVNAIPSASYI